MTSYNQCDVIEERVELNSLFNFVTTKFANKMDFFEMDFVGCQQGLVFDLGKVTN